MKFYDSLVFLLQNLNNISILPTNYEYYCCSFINKNKKPLIRFEPMTYALPWRYSTAELKGPRSIKFLNKELDNMSLVHIFVTAYTSYIDKVEIYVHRFIRIATH